MGSLPRPAPRSPGSSRFAAARCSPSRGARSRTAPSILRDGKIAAVGANVQVPAGAEVVDATGQFVTPGIIDAHSHIAADAINEGGTTVSSMTGIEDVLDPTDINIYRELAGGVTTANVLHGSANPIGGKNQVIKLRWGKTRAEDIALRGRDAGDQVRARREPEGHAPSAQADRPAPLPGDAHGRRVRDPRRLHARQGVPEGVEGLREEQGQRNRAARRAAICSSSRWSRSSRASGSSTRTATAPTRS